MLPSVLPVCRFAQCIIQQNDGGVPIEDRILCFLFASSSLDWTIAAIIQKEYFEEFFEFIIESVSLETNPPQTDSSIAQFFKLMSPIGNRISKHSNFAKLKLIRWFTSLTIRVMQTHIQSLKQNRLFLHPSIRTEFSHSFYGTHINWANFLLITNYQNRIYSVQFHGMHTVPSDKTE